MVTKPANIQHHPESGGSETKPLANGPNGNEPFPFQIGEVVKQLHD